MIKQLNQIRTIQSEIDLKLTAARTVMTAIENLFAHSAIKISGDISGNADIHNLVLIALDYARDAESMSGELETSIREALAAA